MKINADIKTRVINGRTFLIHGKDSKRAKEIINDPVSRKKIEMVKARLRETPISKEIINEMFR